MPFTLDELKKRIIPIAQKYDLRAVYLFGSYARNEATEQSDVDILIDRTGSKIRGLFDMGALYEDLSASIGRKIDLITTHTLQQQSTQQRFAYFVTNLEAERVRIL